MTSKSTKKRCFIKDWNILRLLNDFKCIPKSEMNAPKCDTELLRSKTSFFLKKQIKTAKELNNLLQIKKEKMNNLNKNASTQLWKTCGKMDSIPKIDKFEIVSNILEGR